MAQHVSTAEGDGASPAPDYRAKFQERFWPPAAVLAWIIWRSPAVVKECWGGSLETVRAKLDEFGPLAHVFDHAMEQLLSVQRQDRVSSSGKRDEAWDPEDITAKQWALGRLRFATDAQGKDYITNEERVPEEGDADDIWNTIERNERKRFVRYDAPGLCRDSVMKAFPPTGLIYRRTGVSGRPGSQHFVTREFERRILNGTALRVLAEEAKALEVYLDGLREKDETIPSLKAGRIENVIRDKHRHWKNRLPSHEIKD
jgi:hypothetical protein